MFYDDWKAYQWRGMRAGRRRGTKAGMRRKEGILISVMAVTTGGKVKKKSASTHCLCDPPVGLVGMCLWGDL